MKRIALLFFCLSVLIVSADRRGQLSQQRAPSSAWVDPSSSNTLYAWWVATDKPVSGTSQINDTNPWIDRVKGILLQNGQNTLCVTNDIKGMTGGNAQHPLTNAPLSATTNSTVCVIVEVHGHAGTQIIYTPYDFSDATQGATPGGIGIDANTFRWGTAFTGGPAISGTISNSKIYDLILNQTNGTILVYTNGVQSVSLASRLPPSGGWPWYAAIHDSVSAVAGFDGWIKEILVWTNSFSSLQFSNVHYYATNTYQYTP